MFDSACLVMARIQFSLIIKKRLDVQNVIKIALVNFVIYLSINLTYDSIIGLFPDYMMILKVTPVFKGGAVQIFVISGPYLYLYVFSKILERLMYNRLYKHLLIWKYFIRKNSVSEKAIKLVMHYYNLLTKFTNL